MWRLNNLYHIKTKSGQKIKFKPNWAQQEIITNLHNQNIILKARQLGITTLFSIIFLDHCIWNTNINAAIIADRLKNAKEIFRDRVKFAYDNLHPYIREICPAFRDNAEELRFASGSTLRVSTSLRSSTNQLLLISEFGKICKEFPGKAQEIVTGALNTVQTGQFIAIESTAEGRGGYFYDMVMEAKKKQDQQKALSQMDYKLHFLPWWKEPSYSLDNVNE